MMVYNIIHDGSYPKCNELLYIKFDIVLVCSSRMKQRKDCREVEMVGAFPGADVVRGKDWNLEDKDGTLFR